MSDPFAVKDCALIAVATGEHAQTLRELKDKLVSIPTSCIYYHFWGGLLRPRFDDPEYLNDFAIWSWRSLHDKTLAERLALIDPTDFGDLDGLRRELVEVIEERLEESELLAWMIPSRRFYFVRSQIVVFDTGKRIDTIEDLTSLIPHMSSGTIFYHFIDARRRTPQGKNDFTEWLAGSGDLHQELADRIAGIDPYFTTLGELREEVHRTFTVYLKERRG
ncbi:MAG TPA: DUF5752 family protein [Deltaproteobacteria bacterium]|nr:DUF5752 family protein [Deltaproteobacteria bacterium]HPR55858.1 DUF5752 family protein [Deltaproteobacteria bacterium]HXK48130.1 DUF5752 family protein [Deltaproteobacteria bacterium]